MRITRRIGALLPLAALPLALSAADAQRGGPVPQQPSFNISSNPLLSSFRFRNIGPASMGGRLDDIEVSLSNPNVIYLGYAVGGVWKSVNNAVSFEPVFNSETTASIGDIAIHPTNPDIVYVGTGEPNNRQTNSFGDGVYKTTDGGKTWTHIGLRETQSIGRVIIDPRNPEVVYVAAEGHLFGPDTARGLYKTVNGGKTWDKIKYIDENTGFSDIAMDPSNSNILYAASYQRRRTSCCFNGGGPGSGLWKSEDAGRTWKKFDNFGIPAGLTIGRVAVAVAPSNPNIVYAQLQVGETGTPEVARGGRGGGGGRAGQGVGRGTLGDTASAGRAGAGAGGGGFGGRGGPIDYNDYNETDNGNVNACRMPEPDNAYPGGLHAEETLRPKDFKVPTPDPKQGGVYRSNDKGRTWTHVSNCDSRPMYFSQLRIDPTNPDIVYVSDLPVDKSVDGGKTFFVLGGGSGSDFAGGHVDQHARWIDPKNGNHIMVGNDGGFQISWDQGRTWDYVNTMTTSLAYQVSADMRRPYYVYTGLQDNGSWGGPSSTRTNAIYNSDWFGMCGGDGFYTAVNPEKPWIAYCESQDGSTSRYNFKEGGQQSIRPSAGGGGRGGRGGGGGAGAGRGNVLNAQPGDQYRFNWNTPYMLSPHDPNIVWYGGNRLFKSYNGGDTYVASPDLTKQIDRRSVTVMGVRGDQTMLAKNDGLVGYSTIITVNESPVMPGVVWAGTDDGNLQVSRDGGTTFTEVGKNIPLPEMKTVDNANLYWISRVEASHFDAGTAYVSVDGHRNDDLRPHVYKTTDYGATFKDITGDLPSYGNVQVIREGTAPGPNGAERNRDLLFAGTEFGLYVSLNGGQHWEPFMNDYPTVRTDDILVHPRDGDLIVATHGRGLWIADDITALQQLTPSVQSSDAYLFDIRPAVNYLRDVTAGQHTGGQKGWSAPNAPRGTAISYYLKAPASSISLSVTGPSGPNGAIVTQNLAATNTAGVNRVNFPAVGGGGRGGRGGAPPVPTEVTINGRQVQVSTLPQAQQDSIRQAAFAQAAAAFGFGGGGRGGAGGPNPGTYTAKLTVNGREYTKTFQVLEDIWANDRWAIDR